MNTIIDAVGYDSEDTTDEIVYVALAVRQRSGGLVLITSNAIQEHRILWNSQHVKGGPVPLELNTYFKMMQPRVTPAVQFIPDKGENLLRGLFMPDGTFMAVSAATMSGKHTPSKTPVERANISGRHKRDKEQGK